MAWSDCILSSREDTSAAQKSSFSNTESAAALGFLSYLYRPLILKSAWSKRNHSKFHIFLGTKSYRTGQEQAQNKSSLALAGIKKITGLVKKMGHRGQAKEQV